MSVRRPHGRRAANLTVRAACFSVRAAYFSVRCCHIVIVVIVIRLTICPCGELLCCYCYQIIRLTDCSCGKGKVSVRRPCGLFCPCGVRAATGRICPCGAARIHQETWTDAARTPHRRRTDLHGAARRCTANNKTCPPSYTDLL